MENLFYQQCLSDEKVLQTCIDKVYEEFNRTSDELFNRFNQIITFIKNKKKKISEMRNRVLDLSEEEKLELGVFEYFECMEKIKGFQFDEFFSQKFFGIRKKEVPEYVKPNPSLFTTGGVVDISEDPVLQFKIHSNHYLFALTKKKLLIVDIELPKSEIKQFTLPHKVSLFCIFSDMSHVLLYDYLKPLKISKIPKNCKNLEFSRISNDITIKIQVLQLTPNNKYAISGHKDYGLKIWEISSKSLFKTINLEPNCIPQYLIISENSEEFYLATSPNSIYAWNLNSLELLKTFVGHTERVNFIKLIEKETQLVSSSKDSTIKIWNNKEKPDCLHSFKCKEEVFCFSFDFEMKYYLIRFMSSIVRAQASGSCIGDEECVKETNEDSVLIERIESTKIAIFLADGLRFFSIDS
jgi:hypothetical protein